MHGQQPAPTREVLPIMRLPNSEQGQGAEQEQRCRSPREYIEPRFTTRRAPGTSWLHRGLVTSFDGI